MTNHKSSANKIWDRIRKKWVLRTPEEIVRQQVLLYLTKVLHLNPHLIAIEQQIQVAKRILRFDIVIYKEKTPWIVVECKETTVQLTQSHLSQLISYNHYLKANILILTNGVDFFCWDVINDKFIVLDDIIKP
ncbi:MAG: type I restriction enzyme HsdR N-terminal domain-containing protein [Phycisphaerales bacterium]|nr:type I restriction enzyme HsdR N-terminal domain-containing protein [Phycisphaerales bacterium]